MLSRLISPHFPYTAQRDTMGWDRVIQDSDEEEEPLIEDDILASTDPFQDSGTPIRQDHNHHAAVQQADYPELTTAIEPQLSVNFDQFLQSQDGAHGASSLSQQQREERWIPSTSEGGGGSTGARENSVRDQAAFELTFHV